MSKEKAPETTPENISETTPETILEAASEVTKSKEPAVKPEDIAADDGKDDLYIPRGNAREEKQVVIGINGKNWVIPRGQHVRVPKFVADEYRRSVAASDVMYVRKEEMAQEEPQNG